MDLSFMYSKFAPQDVAMIKSFNNEMNISNDAVDNAQKLNVMNYVADIIAALRSGLKWSALSLEEIDLVRQNCHESHWKQFENLAKKEA